jgi:hypothetical protein
MQPTIAALEGLSRRVHEELALFEYPMKDWVTPVRGSGGEMVHNVTVVGGGQTGLGIAFALQRERISGVTVLDAAPDGAEGPWVSFARMITLRTLKFLTGPDLGVPSLTFRVWHEAQFGKRSWAELVRIPKDEWMRYLVWFRETLRIPVRNKVRLMRIEPRDDLLALHLQTPGGQEIALTRKLVLATGIDGAGQRRIPAVVRDRLPCGSWAHTSDAIQFEMLAGKRVAVLGGGASAFDNAATALEHGAASVDVFIRRDSLPEMNSYRALESAGYWRNFGDLDDALRWRFMRHLLSLPMPPPRDTLDRTFRFNNVHVHYGSPVLDAAPGLRLRTPRGWHDTDFLILGTGFTVDLHDRPEFTGIADAIATWGDRHAPPAPEKHEAASRYPYVGRAFELVEKVPGVMPALRNIHLFNAGSLISMGPVAGGLNGMPFGIPRLIAGLSRDFFRQQAEALFTEFSTYDEPDAWETVRAGA